MKPVKPFKTIDEQIDLLAARGMRLERAQAAQWLRSVGYYRLSGYWYPFRSLDPASTPREPVRLDRFQDGTNLTEVVRLYEFDRKLRTLVHDGIERIEVALRSHVGHVLGGVNPMAHTESAHFRDQFDHQSWMATLHRRIRRAASHHEYVRHHLASYDGKVPIWVLTDVLDFSDVSKLFAGMTSAHQAAVTSELGFDFRNIELSKSQVRRLRRNSPLKGWFEQLTVVRNFCAHHGRIWNSTFTPASTTAVSQISGLECLPEGQSERLFGALTMMSFLLRRISPYSSWTTKIRSLILNSFNLMPHRSVSELGFPDDWRELEPWASSAGSSDQRVTQLVATLQTVRL